MTAATKTPVPLDERGAAVPDALEADQQALYDEALARQRERARRR